MIPPAPASAGERPHKSYKRRLLAELLAARPATVLDVGCGTGDLLLELQREGIASAGVEPEAQARELASARGLQVEPGRAETLPFADGAFDIVVLDYVAHHVERLGRALTEAVRVAKRGVFILDCWYDDALPCQRVARAYDEWVKRLDRRQGFVHDPCVDPALCLQHLRAAAEMDVSCTYDLILRPVSVAATEASARARLKELGEPENLRLELEGILDQARLSGLSDDGCVLIRALRQ